VAAQLNYDLNVCYWFLVARCLDQANENRMRQTEVDDRADASEAPETGQRNPLRPNINRQADFYTGLTRCVFLAETSKTRS